MVDPLSSPLVSYPFWSVNSVERYQKDVDGVFVVVKAHSTKSFSPRSRRWRRRPRVVDGILKISRIRGCRLSTFCGVTQR